MPCRLVQVLIGIDHKRMAARGRRERRVSRRSEIARPRKMHYPRAGGLCNAHGAVRGARVRHHDFIHHPMQRLQTICQVLRFVAHNEHGARRGGVASMGYKRAATRLKPGAHAVYAALNSWYQGS